MLQYTTGEIAKLCGVSIRTVQFYDAKDLLKPSDFTEGGRRLYSEDDLNKMQFICMLKALGLTLTSIKNILDSNVSGKVLLHLLDEQAEKINSEISDKQKQLDLIKAIIEGINNTGNIPVNSVSSIENIMNNKKKLRKTHIIMLAVGVLMDIIQIVALIFWIAKGIWQPFAIGIPIVIIMGILITRMYYNNTCYICENCNTEFKPTLGKFLFSKHNPKSRELKCPECSHVGCCIEIASEK